MNILLWVLRVLLAVAFFAHGWLFLSPPPEIAKQMNESLPRWFQLFLGVAEVTRLAGSRPITHTSAREERPVPRVTIDYGDGRKLEGTTTGNSTALPGDGVVMR